MQTFLRVNRGKQKSYYILIIQPSAFPIIVRTKNYKLVKPSAVFWETVGLVSK